MSSLDREIVLQTLQGFAEVNRITRAERRARLEELDDDQAQTIFEGMIQGVIQANPEEHSRLAKYRLKHHLKIRQAMRRLSQAMGYESSF